MSASSSSERLEMSFPSNVYVPCVAVSRHPRIFISVDLPDPDGPIIAINSPLAIENDTRLSTWVSMAPVLYILVILRSSIIHIPCTLNCKTPRDAGFEYLAQPARWRASQSKNTVGFYACTKSLWRVGVL